MRIWITGVGMVTPLGAGAAVSMDRICRAERAFAPVRAFDGSAHKIDLVSEWSEPAGSARETDRFAHAEVMAIAAAREALAHARIEPSCEPVDFVFGTTTAGTQEIETDLAALFDHPIEVPLSASLTDTLALSAERIIDAVGPFRRVRTISSACSTGAMALVLAASWIRSGRSSRVLAGAADALCRLTLTGFNALGSLDASPCRPFDRSRSGLSLGEGAAFLVIERDDVAASRGAKPIAELAGWGAGAEAHHITNPEPTGRTPIRVTRRALATAGLTASEVDYVNAHGTATALNDPMEMQALHEVFGDQIDRVFVSSIKGQVGHTLGAAGAIEAAVTAMAIQQGRIPPTAGLSEPDDTCRARHVQHQAVNAPVRSALSSSFGFGGLDAVLLLSQPGFAAPHPAPAQPCAVVASVAALGPLGLLDASSAYEYLEPGALPAVGAIGFDADALLDLPRARRLGRSERMLAATVGRALDAVGGRHRLGSLEMAGLVASRLSGNPGPTARFLARARDRGPRFAPPADFPNLMLSSVAGHTSIYHGLQGPTLATTDRQASGAAAILTALDLLSSGCADVMIAGSADDWDLSGQSRPIVRSGNPPRQVPSTEGASAIILCAPEHPVARAIAHPVCVLFAESWFGDVPHGALDRMTAPAAGALIVTVGDVPADFVPASWRDVASIPIESRAGYHDAISGMAAAAAVSQVGAGRASVVLVVARGARTTTALLFGAQ